MRLAIGVSVRPALRLCSKTAGRNSEGATHEQKPEPTADELAPLPTDNGDAGDHLVEEKGKGLQAAAGATAELEEAITDAKPSGEVPTWMAKSS